MKKKIFNDDNLTIDEIQDNILKARAVIINDKNEVLLCCYQDTYLFPGGAIEKEEDIINGLVREVKEETGIELNLDNLKPFLFVEQFIKNYAGRKTENNLCNRRNATYYYIIHTNEDINRKKMSLMENEIKANLHPIRIKLDEVKPLLENNISNNPKNKYFTREILFVIEELLNNL